MTARSAVALSLFVAGGCASMPPVNYSYYPATGVAMVAITQSLDCSKDKKRLVVVTTPPSVTTKYSADQSVQPWSFEASRLRSDMANTDFTLNLYEDGRLKGINAQSTGQGEAILKSVVSFMTAVTPLVGGSGPGKRAPKLAQCDVIANWGNGKPVSINYAALYPLDDLARGQPRPIGVAPDSQLLLQELNAIKAMPAFQARLQVAGDIVPGSLAGSRPQSDRVVNLKLQRVANGTLRVLSGGTPIWTGTLLVPKAAYYELPVPRAALFGKSTFAVEVGESGAVTKLQYGRETGAAGPFNVMTAAATAAAPSSAAEQAGEMKARADLIAQSQRLARCQAQPDQCQ